MNHWLLLDHRIERLKEDIRGPKKALFDELTKLCEEYRKKDLPVAPPQASTTYMGIAIFNLALLYRLTLDVRYADEAKRWMRIVTGYDVWGYSYLVNVDLSASWILFGFSVGFQYLEDAMTAEEAAFFRAKLIKQATIIYDYRVQTYGHGWSTQYYQNHNWINMTGLAAVGYVLEPTYPPAQAWIQACKENFQQVYPNLAADGSDYEGVAYWHYGVLWLLVYADLAKQKEHVDYFKSSAFLKNTFDYKFSQTLPDFKQNMNFGDQHDYRSGHSLAIYYKLASEYNNGYAQQLANFVLTECYDEEQAISHIKPGIRPQIGLALLWMNPGVKPKNLAHLPNYHYFPDLGLASFRHQDKRIHRCFPSSVPSRAAFASMKSAGSSCPKASICSVFRTIIPTIPISSSFETTNSSPSTMATTAICRCAITIS
ncbi:MAG: DUF4962 domain-containing protein [Bacillus subtilis]|nr:DUF4962 domain-containing protein [Bacillus subtilis]